MFNMTGGWSFELLAAGFRASVKFLLSFELIRFLWIKGRKLIFLIILLVLRIAYAATSRVNPAVLKYHATDHRNFSCCGLNMSSESFSVVFQDRWSCLWWHLVSQDRFYCMIIVNTTHDPSTQWRRRRIHLLYEICSIQYPVTQNKVKQEPNGLYKSLGYCNTHNSYTTLFRADLINVLHATL